MATRPHGLWPLPPQLPKPRSVSMRDLRCNLDRCDASKVLAVLSDPTHPLFTRCARLACCHEATGDPPPEIFSHPYLPTVLCHAIDSLPATLSPRQAGIAAALLAFTLMRAEGATGGKTLRITHGHDRILQQLLHHGVLNPAAADPATPEETGGLPLSAYHWQPPTCYPGGTLPAVWDTPRHMTMCGLAMPSLIEDVDAQSLQQVWAGLPSELKTEALLEWMVEAIVSSLDACMLVRISVWLERYPGADLWLRSTLLQRPQLAEQHLMAAPGKLLEAAHALALSPGLGDEACCLAERVAWELDTWVVTLVNVYMVANTGALELGPNQLPPRHHSPPPLVAPLFLVRMTDAVLSIFLADGGPPFESNIGCGFGAGGSATLPSRSGAEGTRALARGFFADYEDTEECGMGLVLSCQLASALWRPELQEVALRDGVLQRMVEAAARLDTEKQAMALLRPVCNLTISESVLESGEQLLPGQLHDAVLAAIMMGKSERGVNLRRVLEAQVAEAIDSGRSEILENLIKAGKPPTAQTLLRGIVSSAIEPGAPPLSAGTAARIIRFALLPGITGHGSISRGLALERSRYATAICMYPGAAEVAWSTEELADKMRRSVLQVACEAWLFHHCDKAVPILLALNTLFAHPTLPKPERVELQNSSGSVATP